MTALGIRTGGLTTQSFSWLAKKHHLTENEVRDLDARYKAADLDRSGQLDRHELTLFLKHTIAIKATEAGLEKFLKSQWHNVDRDGNGTVDFDEFLSLYAVIKAHPVQASGAAATPAATTGAAAGKGAAATPAAAGAKPAAAAKGAATKNSQAKGLGVARREKRQKRRAAQKAAGKKQVKRPTSFPLNTQLNQQNLVTHEIVWSVIRKNSSFLVTRPNGYKGRLIQLTRERGNLTNVHSRYNSGLLHNRTVDISAVDGGINLRLNAPSAGRRNQPARQFTNTKLVADNRQLSSTLIRQLKGYRANSIPAALARAQKLRNASNHGAPSTSKRQSRAASAAAPTTAAPAQ